MDKINIKFKKGFTLVETLVAISILSLSIAATFTAVQTGLQTSSTIKDQISAFYLAQEGMEYIKNVRDNNALNAISGGANTWLTGLSEVPGDFCYFGKVCQIDVPLATISNCGGGTSVPITNSPPNLCPVLRQDNTGTTPSLLLGYNNNWTTTRFKREIQFEQINLNEIRAVITISWSDRGATKSFQVSETLFKRL